MHSNNIRVKIKVNKQPNPKKSALARLWSYPVQGMSLLWDTNYYT